MATRQQTKNGQPLVYLVTPPTLNDGDAGAFLADVSQNAKVTLATLIAGEDQTYGVMKTEQRAGYTNITSSTLIKTGAGRVMGIFVSSASSTPTLKLWDNTSAAATVLIDTFTPVGPAMYNFGSAVAFATGLYVTISGSVTCTVFSE